jgi:hypothetical protein
VPSGSGTSGCSSALLVDLAEDRLDGLLPLGVVGLAVVAGRIPVMAARSPSLRDAVGLPSLRGLP